MAELDVDLVATDRRVWSGRARIVSAPASEGEIGVLVGHSPLLSLVRKGIVRITPVSGSPVEYGVTGGFISVDSDQVTIVADAVVDPQDVRPVASHG